MLTWTLLAALVTPVGLLALWSVTARWPWPLLLPETWTLRGWASLLAQGGAFRAPLRASLLVASTVTLLSVPVALPVALFLARTSFRGKRVAELCVLLPALTPAYVMALGLHGVLLRLGGVESFAAVVACHLIVTAPYMIRTLQAWLEAFGAGLEDQARTLGATPLAVLRRVTFPLLVPALGAGSAFVFLGSLGEYMVTSLVGGGPWTTLPLAVFPYLAAGDRTVAAAGSLLLALPALVLVGLVEAMAAFKRRGFDTDVDADGDADANTAREGFA